MQAQILDHIPRGPLASEFRQGNTFGKNAGIIATFLHYARRCSLMPVTTLSSREFNQDTGRAKKAANEGLVFITDRGIPAHVLLSIEDYQRLTGTQTSVVDQLGLPLGVEDITFEVPVLRELARSADFA